MDPAHIAPSRTDANSNGHFPQSNGQQPAGTPRGFNLQNFSINQMMQTLQSGLASMPIPPMFAANFQAAAAGGWGAAAAAAGGPAGGNDDRGAGGPIRRGGGMMGGGGHRFQNRPGPYDRRQNPRWGGGSDGGAGGGGFGGGPGGNFGGGGRGGGPRGMPAGGRWGDGAAGGAAVGPREAVQGRSLKSYEDLDHVAGGGGGELNY